MVNYIVFNNVSSLDKDCWLSATPPIPFSNENVEQVKISGRSGSLTRKLGTYDDKIIKCSFKILATRELLNNKINVVENWLRNIEDNKLFFSWDLEKYYIVKSIEVEDITRILSTFGEFTVSFVCDPFRYSKYDGIISLTGNSTIVNQGTYYSLPVLKIYGSGTVSFSVNGNTITVTNVTDSITIDCEALECYSGTTRMNNKMTGDFPKLETGENTINLISNISKIEMTPKWRWL